MRTALGTAIVDALSRSDIYGVAAGRPEYVADFTRNYYRTDSSSSDFDTAFDVTGASLKTMVDSDGVLKWGAHNLLTYSEDFSNAAWTKSGATVTSNAATAPDGTTTAEKLIEDAVDSSHRALQNVSTGGAAGTFAVFAKSAERSWCALRATDTTSTGLHAWFDLDSGIVGTVDAGITAAIRSVGNGWYCCEIRIDNPSATIPNTQISVATGDGAYIYTGDGTSGIYIWGAHLYRSDLGGMVNNPERGDSYVPTTDSAKYLPRIGHHIYNGAEWVNEGVLVESEARTNLITYSEDFTDASWTTARSILDANAIIAPDGTTSATKFIATSDLGPAFSRFTLDPAGIGRYTGSCFFKAGEYGFAALRLRTENNTAIYTIVVDLSDGSVTDTVVVGSPNGSYTVESFSNGWYRISVSADHTTGLIVNVAVSMSNSATPDYEFQLPKFSGDNTSGVYIWGAQLEEAATSSSYIPTAGATATRSGETIFSDALSYDSSAMWFTLEGLETYADKGTAEQVVLFKWRFDTSNRIELTLDTDGAETGEITLTVVSGGLSWSVAADYLTPGINQPFSIAWRVTSSEINLAVGGTAQTAVATTSIPDLSAVLAFWGGSSEKTMGTRALFRQGTGDIGDDGIEQASA